MQASIILLIIGAFIILGVMAKPSFFWNHRKAVALRNAIGDKGTFIFYLLIGIGALLFGIYGFLNDGFDMSIFSRYS